MSEKRDTELTTCRPSRQMLWHLQKTHYNGTSESKCIWINCPDLIHRRDEVVRISRSWLHGKSKWPKQKELENLNLEEILGENIFSNEFSIPSHPISGVLGTVGKPWPNLSVPEETFRWRMKPQTWHSAVEKTHPKCLTLAASPHLSSLS